MVGRTPAHRWRGGLIAFCALAWKAIDNLSNVEFILNWSRPMMNFILFLGSMIELHAGKIQVTLVLIGVAVMVHDYRHGQKTQGRSVNEALLVLFRKTGLVAARELSETVAHMAGYLRGMNRIEAHLARMIDDYSQAAIVGHFDEMETELASSTPKEAQEMFLKFYVDYQALVRILHEVGADCNFDFERDGKYRTWKALDIAFLSGMNELQAETQFSTLRNGISAYAQSTGENRRYVV